MHEWQPIETAPKDGRRIMAWEPRLNRPVLIRWLYETAGSPCWWSVGGDSRVEPSHWMPEPNAPKASRASLAVPATEPPIDRIYELIVGAMVRMEKGERERDLAEARKLCEDYFHAKIVRAGAGDRQPQKDFETKSPANSNDSA